jgi:IMP dehydrogenase
MTMDLLELVKGCTFDDVLLTPQCGVLPRRDPDKVDLSARFTDHLTLKRPLVSANMDTVTRAAMAIVLAEEGGIGVIDRGFRAGDIEPQVAEVAAVKRRQHGVITDPHSITPDQLIGDAIRLMEQTGVGTLTVVDPANRLVGLLTERAERLMIARKIKKLPLVDGEGRLAGLMTAKDLLKHKQHPFATRDAQGRLRVGAAVGAVGDYLERALEVIRAGADVLVIDIAHGHSLVMERALNEIRKRVDSIDVVAGNVATAEGARFLLDRGANAIKVGIGPGGGCSTRITTNFGIPQVEALARCRREVDGRVPLIADGGIKRDGSIALALLFGGDTVMLGSAFAGTEEAPGDVVFKSVLVPESQKIVKVPFKVFRGMASIGAVRDRLDLEDADPRELEAIGAEGIEVSVPLSGSARSVIREMLKHLCSAISYGGATSLVDLQDKFRGNPQQYVVRLTEASRTESFQR